MAYSKEFSSCSLNIKMKTGTLASGADSVTTLSLGGANMDTDAQTLIDVADALAAVVSTPVLEVLRVDNYVIAESE